MAEHKPELHCPGSNSGAQSLNVQLGQTIYLSGPQFLHLQTKDNHMLSMLGFYED